MKKGAYFLEKASFFVPVVALGGQLALQSALGFAIFDSNGRIMDLRFSRIKKEIVKRVEATDDENLLNWMLLVLETGGPAGFGEVSPLSEADYHVMVQKSRESAKSGRLLLHQEIKDRHAAWRNKATR